MNGWQTKVDGLRAEMQAMARDLAELRRQALSALNAEPETLRCDGVELDAARRELRDLSAEGHTVRLTMKEFELLRLLLTEPGGVFSRDALLAQVWGVCNPGYHRAVDAHFNRMRKKLGEAGKHLEGVYGAGYRWGAGGQEAASCQ